MWLEDGEDASKLALACCRQRCPNLGRMVTVVFNSGAARLASALLKPTIHALELRQSFADLLEVDMEFHRNGDGCRCIQSVMRAGHVDTEVAEIFALKAQSE